MPFLYYLFALFLYVISLPFLFFLIFKKKYKKSIPARFFLYKNPPFTEKRYYFHACSLGETKALKPLIENFDKVNISVITNTGFEEAKKYKNAEVRFLPYEIFIPFWLRPCKSLIIMEAELWYMLIFFAKRRCEKVVLLNARISDKSFPKYLKFKWFYKKIFENIDLVLAQSEKDKERLEKLGAKNVKVTGNIKTYFKPQITAEYKKKKPLIVLASTHPNEEEMILKNIPLDKYQVAIVPRHPERFEEVEKIAKKFGDVEKLSEINDFTLKKDIVVVDKMGELVNFYKIADIVVLGGSFVDNVGGHNPIEAAYFNKPIISGKYFFNQHVLYNEVDGIKICEISEISECLNSLKPTKIKRTYDIKKVIEYIK
jgi:3-deoxy-D-manno-octulosonic-acid transferase